MPARQAKTDCAPPQIVDFSVGSPTAIDAIMRSIRLGIVSLEELDGWAATFRALILRPKPLITELPPLLSGVERPMRRQVPRVRALISNLPQQLQHTRRDLP